MFVLVGKILERAEHHFRSLQSASLSKHLVVQPLTGRVNENVCSIVEGRVEVRLQWCYELCDMDIRVIEFASIEETCKVRMSIQADDIQPCISQYILWHAHSFHGITYM